MKYIRQLIAVIAASAILLLPSAASAHSCSLTLAASTSSVVKDASFTVQARLNATAEINVVQAYVTFDPSKVTLLSASYSGSPWVSDTGDTASGSNFYRSSRFRLPPHDTGTSTVVTLTFRALADNGSTAFNITAGNSYALTNGQNNLASVSGVSVNFTAPAATPTPPASTNPPAGSSNPTPSPAQPTTGTNNASADPGSGTPTPTVAVTAEEAANAPNQQPSEDESSLISVPEEDIDPVVQLRDASSEGLRTASSGMSPFRTGLIIASVGAILAGAYIAIIAAQNMRATRLSGVGMSGAVVPLGTTFKQEVEQIKSSFSGEKPETIIRPDGTQNKDE